MAVVLPHAGASGDRHPIRVLGAAGHRSRCTVASREGVDESGIPFRLLHGSAQSCRCGGVAQHMLIRMLDSIPRSEALPAQRPGRRNRLSQRFRAPTAGAPAACIERSGRKSGEDGIGRCPHTGIGAQRPERRENQYVR
jgi:hypothetical protein